MYSNSNSFFGSMPVVVKNLIIINVLMWGATQINTNFMVGTFAMFFPTSPNFKVFQVLTHMFMHVDFIHLFFNMYVLWMFGCTIERVWGARKFLIYYIITGLGSAGLFLLTQWIRFQSLLSDSLNSDELGSIYYSHCLGASGAVFGILLAFGMMYPKVELQLILPPVRLKAIWFIVICGIIELTFGLAVKDNIAHFAHLGGMLVGFIIILYWKFRGTLYRNDDYHH